jgi:hypothetical protein
MLSDAPRTAIVTPFWQRAQRRSIDDHPASISGNEVARRFVLVYA